jgi:coproporphyrinogen III oxidase-like Fe-S oxidoreductase
MEGLSIQQLQEKWGNSLCNAILRAASHWIKTEHLIETNQHLVLSASGKLFADGIAADLFQL